MTKWESSEAVWREATLQKTNSCPVQNEAKVIHLDAASFIFAVSLFATQQHWEQNSGLKANKVDEQR